VFVDLYTVVRQGLIVGTPSYSLKDIERLYMDVREGKVTTAVGSVVAYHHWLENGERQGWRESEILKEIRDYNEVDCVRFPKRPVNLEPCVNQRARESCHVRQGQTRQYSQRSLV
jgi:predicted RecB family nuclease